MLKKIQQKINTLNNQLYKIVWKFKKSEDFIFLVTLCLISYYSILITLNCKVGILFTVTYAVIFSLYSLPFIFNIFSIDKLNTQNDCKQTLKNKLPKEHIQICNTVDNIKMEILKYLKEFFIVKENQELEFLLDKKFNMMSKDNIVFYSSCKADLARVLKKLIEFNILDFSDIKKIYTHKLIVLPSNKINTRYDYLDNETLKSHKFNYYNCDKNNIKSKDKSILKLLDNLDSIKLGGNNG